MIPVAPLEWIHSHADSGFIQEPFGHYPKALGEYAWDAVSVQPFDHHLHSNNADGDRGDVAMIRDFAKRAARQNPNVQIYIYARWPRITPHGKGTDFDKDDFDPTKPGSGADSPKRINTPIAGLRSTPVDGTPRTRAAIISINCCWK